MGCDMVSEQMNVRGSWGQAIGIKLQYFLALLRQLQLTSAFPSFQQNFQTESKQALPSAAQTLDATLSQGLLKLKVDIWGPFLGS